MDENLNTNTTETTETDSWDYEKVNELLGLNSEIDSESPLDGDDSGFFTDDDEEEEKTEETEKRKGLAKNPWAKVGLIAGLGGLGLWAVSLVFSFAPKTSNTGITTAENSSGTAETEAVDMEETIRPQLAVARQEAEIERLSKLLDKKESTPTLIIDKSDTELTPIEPEIITPVQPEPVIYNDPQPVYNQQPVFEPEPVTYREPPTTPTPTPPPPTPTPTPSPPPAPEPPKVNSMGDWLALASMGSYGGGVVQPEKPQPTVNTTEPRQTINEPTTQPVVQNNVTREKQILMGNKPSMVKAGTRIKAEIVNSMIAVDGESPLLAVITSEPVEVDGKVVIPTGTEIIFESSVHSTGMIIANAIGMLMDNQEVELPRQVLQLRTSGGEPLMATRQNNYGGQVLRRDGGNFILGALGKVGEISNRPRTTSTFNGIGGNSTSSTFDEPNYSGAVLEGGFNPLARQWERRNERAIQELQRQGVVWAIPPGQSVEIIIARSFSL